MRFCSLGARHNGVVLVALHRIRPFRSSCGSFMSTFIERGGLVGSWWMSVSSCNGGSGVSSLNKREDQLLTRRSYQHRTFVLFTLKQSTFFYFDLL
ncbi:Hypothetical protein, putative [Bodo saltans]|uniref:Uncharacterized protein n=1 Tax=Bodo saltans TaxID=75058 RepID=A0A0S4JE41_BODSA|nr:Hypothetical protein, putative [Bodo saltans]|eukprot:CUG89630.1 Hypothetical protein, putative [Bodo saltans]